MFTLITCTVSFVRLFLDLILLLFVRSNVCLVCFLCDIFGIFNLRLIYSMFIYKVKKIHVVCYLLDLFQKHAAVRNCFRLLNQFLPALLRVGYKKTGLRK